MRVDERCSGSIACSAPSFSPTAGADEEALAELLGLFEEPPFPAAGLDQLGALLDRGVELPPDDPELVLRIASEVRSSSRAVALITAEGLRQLRRGDLPSQVAARLKAAAEQEQSLARRGAFRMALARLGNPAAVEALVESLRADHRPQEVPRLGLGNDWSRAARRPRASPRRRRCWRKPASSSSLPGTLEAR